MPAAPPTVIMATRQELQGLGLGDHRLTLPGVAFLPLVADGDDVRTELVRESGVIRAEPVISRTERHRSPLRSLAEQSAPVMDQVWQTKQP